MKTSEKKGIFMAVLAAALYALNSPFSKLLLAEIPAAVMAALLYIGAGLGLSIVRFVQKISKKGQKEQPLTRRDIPYTIGMVLLDIAAPICMMIGLTATTAANASLLNNFEIVATSVIALFVFREKISGKLWFAIGLVTLSSILLSIEDAGSFSFSFGSFFVLLACVCWGFENNCTRKLSQKNPLQIVIIKGWCSGIGSFMIALAAGERLPGGACIACALLLGFVAYGMSIFFYIYAQRELGAARTSTYYALAPFIGTALSLLIFREKPSFTFIGALLLMIAGAYFASADTVKDTNT